MNIDAALITTIGVAVASALSAIAAAYVSIRNVNSVAHKSDVELLSSQLEAQIKLSAAQAKLIQEEREQAATRAQLEQAQVDHIQEELTDTRERLDRALQQIFRLKIRNNRLEIEIVRLGGKVPPEEPEEDAKEAASK